jgi:hypothetical protein
MYKAIPHTCVLVAKTSNLSSVGLDAIWMSLASPYRRQIQPLVTQTSDDAWPSVSLAAKSSQLLASRA